MRASLAASGLLVVLAIAYWLGADAIPKSRLGGAVGADGLPKLLGVTLGLLAAGLAVQTLLEARKRRRAGAGSDGTDAGAADWRAHGRALGVIAIGVGYILLLPWVGYVGTVALLLVAVAVYSGQRPSLATVVFGVVGAVFFYLLFVRLLQVPLPAGAWTSLIAPGA